MKKVKICVFADFHYWPERSPYEPERLDKIIERAKASNADVIVSCGDFSPVTADNKDFLDKFLHNKYNIPVTFCYGNHELERVESLEQLNKLYETDSAYFYKDINGFRFITLDSNHWYDDDGSFHRYPGNYWGSPKGWSYDQNAFGSEQLEWLEAAIDSSPNQCILISHAPIRKSDLPEHKMVMDIIDNANKKSPLKVLMHLSGHTHRNNIKLVNNVVHFNVNSANNGEWQPIEHELYPKEYSDKYPSVKHNADFAEPLSAVITVTENGHIVIDGMETEYIYGVTPEMFGGPFKTAYGISEPRIDSKEYFL